MTPGKTPFDRAVHAQQTSACIQRQVQALRALCSAPVLPCSRCRRGGKRAFEKPILTRSTCEAALRVGVSLATTGRHDPRYCLVVRPHSRDFEGLFTTPVRRSQLCADRVSGPTISPLRMAREARQLIRIVLDAMSIRVARYQRLVIPCAVRRPRSSARQCGNAEQSGSPANAGVVASRSQSSAT